MKYSRYLIITLFCLTLSACAPAAVQGDQADTPAPAASGPEVSVITILKDTAEGSIREYWEPEVKPYIAEGGADDVILAPAGALAGKFGLTAEYKSDTGLIIRDGAGNALEMEVGKVSAAQNGVAADLPQPPELAGGEIMIPARYVAEFFGLDTEQCYSRDNYYNSKKCYLWLSEIGLLKNEDFLVSI
jgi:hypothetical protein